MNTASVLNRVRKIEIVAGKLVNELFAGQYSSTFKGRGMEFAEVREYIPGDDIRSIDWNVTARAGHPFIKKFMEERELTVIFVVDASRSQGFGSTGQLKEELAAEITAVLAFSALRNNDKVGMLLFSSRVEKFIPPRKTRGHVLRLIREVLSFKPEESGTSVNEALDYLNRVQRRKAVVFLLSDFLDQGYDKTLRITQRRHDVIGIPISDPWETAFPKNTWIFLEDAEGGELTLVRRTERAPQVGAGRLETLRRDLARYGVDAIFVNTGTSYVESFLQFFRARAKRLH